MPDPTTVIDATSSLVRGGAEVGLVVILGMVGKAGSHLLDKWLDWRKDEAKFAREEREAERKAAADERAAQRQAEADETRAAREERALHYESAAQLAAVAVDIRRELVALRAEVRGEAVPTADLPERRNSIIVAPGRARR